MIFKNFAIYSKNKTANVYILTASEVLLGLLLGLEECEFEPYIESIEGKLSGKKVVLFGSYGWGSGQWMEEWEARMIAAGAISSLDPLIVCGEPNGDSATECIEFGRKIAKL